MKTHKQEIFPAFAISPHHGIQTCYFLALIGKRERVSGGTDVPSLFSFADVELSEFCDAIEPGTLGDGYRGEREF